MSSDKRLPARFYRNDNGKEPVRLWLKNLPKKDKRTIGVDIKTVEYGWPVGMPTCSALGKGLFEIRTHLEGRIARVLFCVHAGGLVLLHGFIKKTQKTPAADIGLARRRHKEVASSDKEE